MATLRLVPAGTYCQGTGQFDNGSGTPVTEAVLRSFCNTPYPITGGKLDCTKTWRPDNANGVCVYGWEVDTTANFQIDLVWSWVSTITGIGIQLCGDVDRGAFISFLLTSIFTGTKAWVLSHQPDGHGNGSGPLDLPGDGSLTTGDIVKMRLVGTGHATNPVITVSLRRELSDTTLVYDYTAIADLTAINLKDYYSLWSLSTDGCRPGIYLNGYGASPFSIPITSFVVTATKRTPTTPTTPLKYGVISDSNSSYMPDTVNTRQKLAMPQAVEISLIDLTQFNGHKAEKGFGRASSTSATIIDAATYVGAGSSALDIVIVMTGTNDANQATPVTKAAYKANVNAILDLISTACKVLLVRPANINTTDKVVGNAALIEYGDALDEIVTARNITTPGRCYKVSLVSLNATSIADGLHWSLNEILMPLGAAIIAGGISFLLGGVNSVTIGQGATASVTGEATLQLTATLDPSNSTSPKAWSIVSGQGTIDAVSGLFTAPGAGVSAKTTVARVTAGGRTDDITITTPSATAGSGTGVWTMGAPIKVVSAPTRLTASSQSLAAYSRFVVAVAGTLHATGNDASVVSEAVAVGDTWFGLASLTSGNTAIFDAYKITVGV